MTNLILMADGGSRGNPGPAASGFAILNHESIEITKSAPAVNFIPENSAIVHQQGVYVGETTNNVAEWSGLLKGLEWICANYDPKDVSLQVLMDSNLVIQQVQGNWKVKEQHLKTFYTQCREYLNQIQTVSYAHIYREYNKLADKLVNQALDER